MNYEHQNTRQPEYFENARNIGEVMAEYDQLAGKVAKGHEAGYISIVPKYEEIFRLEARSPGRVKIESQMAITRDAVEMAGSASPNRIQALVSAAAETIPSMLNSADANILQTVRAKASLYGAGSYMAEQALNAASSPTVRTVFINMISNNSQNTRSESYGGATTEDEFIRNAFRNGAYGRERRQRQEQPRQEAPRQERSRAEPRREAPKPRSERDEEVDNVISQVTARSRQYSWIQNESPRDVRRIINTVRKLREKAEADGNAISDRNIYIKYRAKAETNPDLTKSVQILEAMMHGDLNGKFPF